MDKNQKATHMSQQEKLLQKFEEEYNRLNEQQKQAVDKIYGPVMVVAGPGTGKTQILSVRIGKILLETDALPVFQYLLVKRKSLYGRFQLLHFFDLLPPFCR